MDLLKSTLKKHFPKCWEVMRAARKQARVEYKVLRQIGIRTLLRRKLWRAAPWKEVLPLQSPRRIRVGDGAFRTVEELAAILQEQGLRAEIGGQAIYFPPDSVSSSALCDLHKHYPTDAGVKIIREPGSIATSHYVSGAGHSRINRKLTSNHGRLALVANLLHLYRLGPRLYDLVELESAGTVWTAYVVRHVDGRAPSAAELKDGLARLRSLETQEFVKVTLPSGWAHKDFALPSCNGNAIVDADKNFHYVDFQNFVLDDYESFLRKIAIEAVDSTHFGTTSLIRGGRFLYQSIPGVRLPARRNIDDRFAVLHQLMEQAGVHVRDRLVLDVGCNIGMMMAEYLKVGASWCHGWDRAVVTPHTERLMLALGCTRFSTTGSDIDRKRSLRDDLPPFVSVSGCVISYLAVRRHMGWLEALASIPWKFLIYEGHQEEDRVQLDRDLAEFRQMVDFEVSGIGSYKDGVSDERSVALLCRT